MAEGQWTAVHVRASTLREACALHVAARAFLIACPRGEMLVCGSAASLCVCLAFSAQFMRPRDDHRQRYIFACIVEGADFIDGDVRLLSASVAWLVCVLTSLL